MKLVVFTCMSETEYSTSVIVATQNSGITCQERIILRTKHLVHSMPVSYLTRNRWRRVQFLANQFWIRWRSEYTSQFQQRRKWNTPQRDSRVGDIVLLQDGDFPRNQWPLARVTKVFPSKDGRIRKVQLLLTREGRRKILERPIHKTILLLAQEASDQDVIPARGASIKDN